jgi:hypothetical protein
MQFIFNEVMYLPCLMIHVGDHEFLAPIVSDSPGR